METLPVVTVVVVTYRSAGTIAACLRSLAGAAVEHDLEVFVVDNASGDATVEIASAFPVHVIEMGSNTGFSAANNAALARARGRWILFANPDTVWPPGSIDRLVSVARGRPDAGIVAPVLEDANGELQPTVEDELTLRRVLGSLVRVRPAVRPQLPPDAGDPQPVPWVHGAALLMPADLMARLGGWDERFFLFAEDMDLCARVRAANSEVLIAPEVRVRHIGGASMAERGGDRFTAPARVTALARYIDKHEGRLARCIYAVAASLVYGVAGLRSGVHRSMAAAAWRELP